MRVDFGGFNVGVPECGLDRYALSAGGDHIGGERVPQIVKVKISNSGSLQCSPPIVLKIAELIAFRIYEQEVLSRFERAEIMFHVNTETGTNLAGQRLDLMIVIALLAESRSRLRIPRI